MISIQKIIDRVVAAEEGEFVAIKCSTFEEMERVRMQLYREMRKLRKSHKHIFDGMSVSRVSENGKFVVYLSKIPELDADRIFFLDKSGNAKPFEKEETNDGGQPKAVAEFESEGEGDSEDLGDSSPGSKATKEGEAEKT